jgi:anti-sigma factor RsiW
MQHLDEGTIHAWLDGQLPAEKADEIVAHASECPECAAMIAEARGLVAASTRILTALDDIPAGVTPARSERARALIVGRRWYDRTDLRVAAALLFVAGASLVVVRGGRESTPSRAMVTMVDNAKSEAPVALDTARGKSFGTEKPTDNRAVKPAPVPNTPATARRALESGTMADAVEKSAAIPAPAMMQAEVTSPPAATAGTPFAKLSIGSVEGRVTDRSGGKGLNGASVNVLGSPIGATTDTTGRFKIESVPAGVQHIVIRRIGYKPQSISLVVDSGTTVPAQVALATEVTSLSNVVVTGLAETVDISRTPLRVLRVDSSASTTRTVYGISPDVEVTLAESRVDTAGQRDFAMAEAGRTNEAAAQRAADAAKERIVGSTVAGGVSGISGSKIDQTMTMTATAPVPLNTISWTDHGRRYTLTGRLTTRGLDVLKTRLMKMRR